MNIYCPWNFFRRKNWKKKLGFFFWEKLEIKEIKKQFSSFGI